MKKLEFFIISAAATALISLNCSDASAWGQKGHDIICAIAENHLSHKAEKRISAILDGKSIIYWANWMDNASHTAQYAYTKTWHFMDVDEGQDFEQAATQGNGNVLTAIDAQIKALKSGKLNKEAEALSLKMLIHFVGDLHCPMHVARSSDRGGNLWQVQFFQKGTNLHSVWDSGVIERAHNWTYSEWVQQLDRLSRKEAAALCEGSPADWGRETFAAAGRIYDGTKVGSQLSYDYVAFWAPTAEEQLLRGGLRLAHVLNEIFK